MKIMITDRDTDNVQTLREALESAGHTVVIEPVKNDAIERMEQESVDVLFLDPAPMEDAQPAVLAIRRTARNYPYIILTSADGSRNQAISAGCDAFISKPVSPKILDRHMEDAARFLTLYRQIGDKSEDFPNAGGVISRSAFNQIFLSSIDRAARYGELSHIVTISIENYGEISDMDGPYAAEYAISKIARHLVILRRQSDIIGQIGKNEYALLLQRPLVEQEPAEAAARFARALTDIDDIAYDGSTVPLVVCVRLITLPDGHLSAEHRMAKELSTDDNAHLHL